MTKITTIDSTPGEDTPIQSNFITRMFISSLVFMAFIIISIGLADHCHLSHVFERAPEFTEGNYHIFLLKARMSNVVSAEALGTDLAAEVSNASIDELNQLINDKSTINEPQYTFANSHNNSNKTHDTNQPPFTNEANERSKHGILTNNKNPIQTTDDHTNSQPQVTHHPSYSQTNKNNTNPKSPHINGNNNHDHYQPQHNHAQSQYNSNKSDGVNEFKQSNTTPQSNHTDDPTHQITRKSDQSLIQVGADNNKSKYAMQSNNNHLNKSKSNQTLKNGSAPNLNTYDVNLQISKLNNIKNNSTSESEAAAVSPISVLAGNEKYDRTSRMESNYFINKNHAKIKNNKNKKNSKKRKRSNAVVFVKKNYRVN